MPTRTAPSSASLPDVPTFLSDLASSLQGRSLTDLPHVTFPSGTFVLVAVPVHVAEITEPKVAIKQSSTGRSKSRRSHRHLDPETSGPAKTSASIDGNVQQDFSQPSWQEDEGKAYSMLCDIIEGYSSNLDQRDETHVRQPTVRQPTVTQPTVMQPTVTQPTLNARPTVKRSGSTPAADPSVKRKKRCTAIKADTLRCMNKARVGFQTCGIPAHRRQDPEYESSDAEFSDSGA